MNRFVLLATFLMVFNALASYQCAGGKEACARGREIYRLEQITGKSCAGGYEACLEYLQNEYENMKMEAEIQAEKLRYAPAKQCFFFYKTDEGKVHTINVCNN